MKARVLYVLDRFPVSMESYIVTEIVHAREHAEIYVVSFGTHLDPIARVDIDYEFIDSEARLDAVIADFAPDILHGHFFETIELIDAASARSGVPYTLRSHAYDIADKRFFDRLHEFAPLANGDRCLGVLAFPYARARLEAAGFQPDKITDTGPVFWFDKFYNLAPRAPTGRILALGSAWPKKNFEALVEIAPALPDHRIDVYASGGMLTELKAHNERHGGLVTFVPHVPFDAMPATYRRYDWYIYTGKTDQCGMPVSVLEAQAAGIGVLHQYTRPEDHAFVGGGGFVFSEIEDVVDIVARPYPEERRRRGYENANRWDVRRHIGDIVGLWYGYMRDRAERPKPGFAAGLRRFFGGRLGGQAARAAPVYVIHLTRDFGRHVHVRETLLPKLPAAEVMAAVDGTKVDPYALCAAAGIEVDVDEYGDHSPVKLACTLSHLAACRKLLASGEPHAVILEDDMDVAADFQARLRDILRQTPESFDVVHLFVHPEYRGEVQRRASGDGGVVRYAPTWGRCAYVVSRAGAQKIIEGFRHLKSHGDIQMAELAGQGRLEVYCAPEGSVDNLGQIYGDYRGERFRSNLHPVVPA